MQNFLLFFSFFLTGYISLLNSQTVVSGLITGNANWTKSGSPYIISNNVAIDGGSIVTIDPGVQIRFRSSSKIKILYGATFVARGTLTDTISFIPDTIGTVMGGIIFEDGAISSSITNDTIFNGSGSILEYCKFSFLKSNGSIVRIGGLSYPAGTGVSVMINNCYFLADTTYGFTGIGGGDASAVHCHYNSSLTITKSIFIDNYSSYNGGSVSSWGNKILIYKSLFSNNKAANYGGAYYNGNNVYAKIINSTFINNKALSGGAIGYEYSGQYIVTGNQFINNTVINDGAAIYDAWFDSYAWSAILLTSNYFYGNVSAETTASVVSATFLNITQIVSQNNAFVNNSTRYFVRLRATFGSKDIKNNYWGINDSALISKNIYDFYADPNYKYDKALFSPYSRYPNSSIPGSAIDIISIATKTDSSFGLNSNNEININDIVFVELKGEDSSPYSKGIEVLQVVNNDTKDTIYTTLMETSETSGIYRGSVTTGSSTNINKKVIVALNGQTLLLQSLKNFSKKILIKVGPILNVDSQSLKFGNVAKGDSIFTKMVLYSLTSKPLTISSIKCSTNIFNISNVSFPLNIIGNDSIQLKIAFKPTGLGPTADTLKITSDGGSASVVLTGTSPYPVLVSNSSALSYGSVARNSSKPLGIKISNTSINTLTVDSIYTKTAQFTVDKSNGNVGTDTLSLNLTFSPITVGSFVDTLYLRNNSTTTLVKIPLSGSSPAPILSTNTSVIDWQSVVKGVAQQKILKLTNSALSALTIDSIFTSKKQFTVLTTSATIAMGETLSLAVSFKADTFAVYTDTLYLRNNSVNGLVKISLKGESPIPVFALSPNVYRKDTVAVGDSSAQVFVIKNTSVNDLTYDSAKTKTLSFVLKGAISGLIKSNDSTVITILFKPNAFGEYSDTLSVMSLGKITKMALSGSSPYPKMVLSLSSLDFGNVRKDTTAKKNIVVKNTSINKLRIDSLKTKSTQFIVDKFTSPIFVTKKDSAVFVVTFKADTIKKYNDTLSIYSNQQIPIIFAALTGSGTLTSVAFSDELLPTVYELNQNFPNPFNPSTTLRYGLPNNSTVSLKVYNVLGQVVADLVNGEQSTGWYYVTWNAKVSTGLYFYRLEAVDVANPNNRFVQVRKMLLLR